MASPFRPIWVSNGTKSIKLSYDNATFSDIEKTMVSSIDPLPVYNVGSLQSAPQYRQNYFIVRIRLNSGQNIDFDIQDVQNQGGWTANIAGLNQAVSDIQGWL